MPWVTEDGQWADVSGALISLSWSYSGDYVKVSTSGSNYSYINQIPRVMNCLNGSLKLGIKIKDGTEDFPKPGCYSTYIWDYFQYHVNRGTFTQVKGYWRTPQPRGRRRMRLLAKGHR